MKCASGVALLITIVLPLIALMAFLLQPVDIRAATNTTVVEVNISEVAQIAVMPTELSWTLLAPGTNGTVRNITVRNTGSSSFSSGVYVSVDSAGNATNNPTAGDDATKYMAGTFLVSGNNTYMSSDEWWFLDQITWNESTYPPDMIGAGSANAWGYVHNKSDSWLWELTAGTDGNCRNGTGGTFKIVQTKDSKDLTSTHSGLFISNNTEWGLWNFDAGLLKEYCVVTYTDCTYALVYKFDRNSSLSTSVCTNASYILPGTLSPGISKMFYVKPHIPDGVPSGTVTNNTITVTAE